SVDILLALGVRYSEVSTGFYAHPPHAHLIHVDANPDNLGKIMKTQVCVHADAGLFLDRLNEQAECLRRPCAAKLTDRIKQLKCAERKKNDEVYAGCGADPMAFLLALRRSTNQDALVFVDVTLS